MKSFVKISFLAFCVIIGAASHISAQCLPKSNFAASYSPLILSNDVNKDCRVSDPVQNANDLLGFGVIETSSKNPHSALPGGVVVNGAPDLTIISYPDFYKDGVFHVSLQITCSGATYPRIGWGTTRLYYTEPFEREGQMIEFKGGFIGLGEADKESVSLTGADRPEGGARVFPITEQIGCIDADHPNQSMILKNVKGATQLIPSSIRQIGEIKYAAPSDNPDINPDDKRFAENLEETFDPKHIPVGKLITACFILNIHPVSTEKFQLIQSGSSSEKLLYTYKENDPHTFNPCETFAFDKAGKYTIFLRWQPYLVDSNSIAVEAVEK